MDKEQFVVRTDGGVRIGTSGMIDGKVVLHVKQGKKQDCILLERLIEKIHHAAANDTVTISRLLRKIWKRTSRKQWKTARKHPLKSWQ